MSLEKIGQDKYTVTINDNAYNWNKLYYKRSYELDAQPFWVEFPYVDNISVGNTLKIHRDDDVVMEAPIRNLGTSHDGETGRVYRAEGWDWKLKNQFLSVFGYNLADGSWGFPIGTALESIIATILTYADCSRETYTATGKAYPMIFGSQDAKMNIRRAIEELCMASAFEYAVEPYKTGLRAHGHFHPQCGTNRTGTIVFKRKELLDKWLKPYYIYGKHKIDRIVVEGRNIGDLKVYGIAQVGGYTYGDPEKWIRHTPFITTLQCQTYAIELLNMMNSDVKYGIFEATDVYDGYAYDVFDTIRVEDDLLGMAEDLRVATLERWVSPEVGERTVLEVCDLDNLILGMPYTIKSGEARLWEAFTGVDNYGKLVHHPDTRDWLKFWDRHAYIDNFLRFDTNIWTTDISAGGSITCQTDGGIPTLRLRTNNVTDEYAQMITNTGSWANVNYTFKCKLRIPSALPALASWGLSDASRTAFIYFYLDPNDNHLKTFTYTSGSTYQVTDLGDWSSEYNQYHVYEISKVSNAEVNFLIDEDRESQHTQYITTNAIKLHFRIVSQNNAIRDMMLRNVAIQERD